MKMSFHNLKHLTLNLKTVTDNKTFITKRIAGPTKFPRSLRGPKNDKKQE